MPNDTDPRRDVTHELKWDPSVLDEAVAVAARDGVVTLAGTVDSYAAKYAAARAAERVAGGWVTLEGEVEWEYQRKAAVRAARDLVGVRGVSNRILLRPKPSAFDVSQRIREARRRA